MTYVSSFRVKVRAVGVCLCSLAACVAATDTSTVSTGTCKSGGGQRCSSSVSNEALTGAVLADDGVRLHLAHLLPTASQSAQIRTGSMIISAALVSIPNPSVNIALLTLTFDGRISWFQSAGRAHMPLASMGPMTKEKHTYRFTSLASSRGSPGVLALGHQGGNASVWRYHDGRGGAEWRQAATVRGSHHQWESVTRIAVSDDGRVLITCTEDNVMLWRVPPQGEGDAYQMHHLHGGEFQASAVDVASLPGGGYVVVIAFDAGALQCWVVGGGGASEEESLPLPVKSAWRLERRGESRFVVLAGSSTGVAATSADGRVLFWSLGPGCALLREAPQWDVQPSQGLPTSSLALMEPRADDSFDVAVAFTNKIIVLDGRTGREISRNTQRGSALALHWW